MVQNLPREWISRPVEHKWISRTNPPKKETHLLTPDIFFRTYLLHFSVTSYKCTLFKPVAKTSQVASKVGDLHDTETLSIQEKMIQEPELTSEKQKNTCHMSPLQ